MRFNEIAWAGFCFYYRSAGDKRYSVIMSDYEFLAQIRNNTRGISLSEFEEKAVLGYINIQNYDLLLGHKLTENILVKLKNLKKEISLLQELSIVECNLDDKEIVDAINRIYSELQIEGLWMTGASKIAHLLNDRLLPPISLNIAMHFGIHKDNITQWLNKIQKDIQEAVDDFENQKYEGTVSQYLSEKLGYLNHGYGYSKSLIKFVDEYYWLVYDDRLPIPPKWIPDMVVERPPVNK